MDGRKQRQFMRRALALARRGRGLVSPNPLVGALLVRDGRIIGAGWHRFCGGPHAEIEALRRAGDARGATLYVTLEPCAHQGRTPPCAPALVAAGVARVVAATGDPDPRVAGRGFAWLESHGVIVERGLLDRESRALNGAYFTVRGHARPLVSLKLAQSLDGRIACADGSSKWLTGTSARAAARRLRFCHDALLVGIGTVLADDPSLDYQAPAAARGILAARGKPYWKVILDSRARLPLTGRLWAGPGRVLVAVGGRAPAARRRALAERGAVVLPAGPGPVEPAVVLDFLCRQGVGSVMVEGGAAVAGSFVDRGLVDRLYLFQAPLLLGGRALPAVGGRGFAPPAAAPRFRLAAVRRFGEDRLYEFVPATAGGT